ncbi:transporter [Terribacillus saccharophilus]|uniref:Transporter n=1 Tax=Terribacillus saccharophilus TaxID=361277 RepID=A0A268H8G0_9BACI|nr:MULTISPECIES: cation diffusion facilitator family transporter [Terribacillus]PAD35060.1 transporter [Terribacillus saccharophilus]PAD95772.1 transporter [Terribacillus saccharophilus]PAD99340.1 transporter [Terribacillus saccharophilus]PAE06167.1 transporter [Terribacillus saccharophilus]VVM34626.1 Cobalt-zinc-cadmium resistance protein [Terribacillus sp. AE2B 122]
MGQYDNLKAGEKGALLSIAAYLLLSFIKLLVAYIGDSDALLADGLNNTTDVVASVAVLVGLRISRKPPDPDHRYGHFRAETIASLVAAFIMISVGLHVLFDTLERLMEPDYVQPDMLTGWTALGSAFVMMLVYRYNYALAKRIQSPALMAAAQDNRSDGMVSIGAFVGIFGAQFGYYWLDPLAGFVVGILICKTAWDIFYDATYALTDGYDVDRLLKIRHSILEDKDVLEVVEIKARLHGNQSLVDVIIRVDASLNVKESHAITERLEKLLTKKHDIFHTFIHIEP